MPCVHIFQDKKGVVSAYNDKKEQEDIINMLMPLIMLPAAIILPLAFAFSGIVEELGTARFLSNIVSNSLPGEFIPAVIFISCSLISFATGRSSAAVGIVLPLSELQGKLRSA